MKTIKVGLEIMIADPSAITEYAGKTFLDKMGGNIKYSVDDPFALDGFELKVSRTGNLTFHRRAKALANESAVPAEILAMLTNAGYSIQPAQPVAAPAVPQPAQPVAAPAVPLPTPTTATTLACLASRNIESAEWRAALGAILEDGTDSKSQNQRINALVSAAGVAPFNGGELKALRNALT